MECFTTVYPDGKVYYELCTFDYVVYRVPKLLSKDEILGCCNNCSQLLIHKKKYKEYSDKDSRKKLGAGLHQFISRHVGISTLADKVCYRLHYAVFNENIYKLDIIEPYFIDDISIVIMNK